MCVCIYIYNTTLQTIPKSRTVLAEQPGLQPFRRPTAASPKAGSRLRAFRSEGIGFEVWGFRGLGSSGLRV